MIDLLHLTHNLRRSETKSGDLQRKICNVIISLYLRSNVGYGFDVIVIEFDGCVVYCDEIKIMYMHVVETKGNTNKLDISGCEIFISLFFRSPKWKELWCQTKRKLGQ